MKSLTGNFSSVRGWALLLALLLGAGMMISACGDEETPAPTTPTPPPAPPPAPPAPEPTGPATPENLRVTASTSTSITWSWNTVEGALGYQGQFSPDATFEATDPTFIIVAPATSHTVSNLSGNMTGHFRVRSGTGTSLTDLTYSDWTEGVSGSTAAPPPATALDAPDNVRSTGETDDSVTLEWDEVDDAATYEVEQREPGDDWDDASCGAADADNVVSDEECVASGLDSGTDYDFRVRGVPADGDTANLLGTWSDIVETRTDGIAPAEPTAPVSGGMGNLNVTWESTDTVNTWHWEPVAGDVYEWWIPADTDIPSVTAANPCSEFPATPTGSGTQFSVGGTSAATPVVELLCVRTKDDDDDEKNLSWAWAAKRPAAPLTTATDAQTTNDAGDVVIALKWMTVPLAAGFNWETRLVADPQRSPRFDGLTDITGRSIQAACGEGRLVEAGDSDVMISLDEVVVRSGLQPYTGYFLCLGYSNEAGRSQWAVQTTKLYTFPAQPGSAQPDTTRSTNTNKVWRIATRNVDNVPREGGDANYEAVTIEYDVTFENTDNNNVRTSTRAPKPADCATPTTVPSARGGEAWASQTVTVTTDPSGIVLTAPPVTANPASGNTRGIDKRVHLCVRAEDGDRDGPWRLSAAATVRGVAP